MRIFSSAFKNLNSLPLLGGLAVLMLGSCATAHPAPEPLSPAFEKFLVRWEKEAPLCSVDATRFSQLVQETPQGFVTRESKKIVDLLERIDWSKERLLRGEANRYFATLPENVVDADYARLLRFGCRLTASHNAVSALVRFETSNARKIPNKRSMKSIEKYVDSGPATGIVQLLLQWSILRELSISPYYILRVPAALAQEMDRFAARIKNEREAASRRTEAQDNFEAYVNFRQDVMQAQELQKEYDTILFKVRGVFFR